MHYLLSIALLFSLLTYSGADETSKCRGKKKKEKCLEIKKTEWIQGLDRRITVTYKVDRVPTINRKQRIVLVLGENFKLENIVASAKIKVAKKVNRAYFNVGNVMWNGTGPKDVPNPIKKDSTFTVHVLSDNNMVGKGKFNLTLKIIKSSRAPSTPPSIMESAAPSDEPSFGSTVKPSTPPSTDEPSVGSTASPTTPAKTQMDIIRMTDPEFPDDDVCISEYTSCNGEGELTTIDMAGICRPVTKIPTEIGLLTKLTNLYLYDNEFTGEIPSEIGYLTELTNLFLMGNQLSGRMPTELGSLTNLLILFFDSNKLSGTIPTELGSLVALEWLELASNKLSGTIPTELGSLVALEQLELGYNDDMSGSVPEEVCNLNLSKFTFPSNVIGCQGN